MKPQSTYYVHLRRAKAGGSRVAVDSFDRPGGPMGKQGRARHKAERRQVKQELRNA